MMPQNKSQAPDKTMELIQARVMARLFNDKITRELKTIAIKGGMAMRLAHGSGRRSDDIDVAADPDTPLAMVQRLVRKAIKESRLTDWLESVTVTEPKQTQTTARWKLHGKLKQTGRDMHVKIEVSLREHYGVKDTQIIKNQDKQELVVFSDERLLMGKLNAFFNPGRQAVRDVYDLYLLCEAGVSLTAKEVETALGERGGSEQCQGEIWERLESMGEHQFQQDIVESWDESLAPKPQLADWEAIRLAVGTYLETLLRGASEAQQQDEITQEQNDQAIQQKIDLRKGWKERRAKSRSEELPSEGVTTKPANKYGNQA